MPPTREIVFYPGLFDLSDDHQSATQNYYRSMVMYYIEHFEFSADMLTRPWEDYLKLFHDHLPKDQSKKNVLLFGSGGGRDAMWLAQHGFTPVLVDLSDEMLNFSRRVVLNGEFFHEHMNQFLERLVKESEQKFIGLVNESAAQHLNKSEVYKQLELAKNVLHTGGIFLLGLKMAPEEFKDKGPVYSVAEGTGKRFFVSWTKKEVQELIDFAGGLGFQVVQRVESPHLTANAGTPSFIRLFFSLPS